MEAAISIETNDAFIKLTIETEFLIFAMSKKLIVKNEIVNAGNKILIGNFQRKKKNKSCTMIAHIMKKVFET